MFQSSVGMVMVSGSANKGTGSSLIDMRGLANSIKSMSPLRWTLMLMLSFIFMWAHRWDFLKMPLTILALVPFLTTRRIYWGSPQKRVRMPHIGILRPVMFCRVRSIASNADLCIMGACWYCVCAGGKNPETVGPWKISVNLQDCWACMSWRW